MSRKYEKTAEFTGASEVVHPRTLYIVQFGKGTPLKLGSTTDIGARLSKMSTDHYEEMSLLYMASGGYAEERELHERFSRWRVRGEWYQPVSEIFDWCAENAEKQLVDDLLKSIEWVTLLKRASEEDDKSTQRARMARRFAKMTG